MTDDQKDCFQSTPPGTLERQIMDPGTPKNEREHWAAAEIARLRASPAPAWQPIETAIMEPGKQVLGCEDGVVFAMEWDRSFKHWVQLEWIDVNPTHWMPLPPPPIIEVQPKESPR